MKRRRNRSYRSYPRYVSVSERRARAETKAAKLAKKEGRTLQPVQSKLRTIAATWWGKAWCENLHAFSDFSNRLPRGKSYLRNGLLIDLQVHAGEVKGLVQGTSLYAVTLKVEKLPKKRWAEIVRATAGQIDSMVELLDGRFSDGVMGILAKPREGLFPTPKEISFDCSCPDWATVCKHVASVMYGVGVRLDDDPRLLFFLRQVDEGELLASAVETGALVGADDGGLALSDDEMSSLFGVDIGQSVEESTVKSTKSKPRTKQTRAMKVAPKANQAPAKKAVPKTKPPAKKSTPAKPTVKRKTKGATPPPATPPARKAKPTPKPKPEPKARRKKTA